MDLTYDAFARCLDQFFVLEADGYRDELRLVSAEMLPRAQSVEGREPFSIILQSSNPRVMPQQIYRFSNDYLGEIELFIVPIDQDESGVRYEAVFS